MGEYEKVIHTFEPVYHKDSKILILGSFPSVKSREALVLPSTSPANAAFSLDKLCQIWEEVITTNELKNGEEPFAL